MDCILTGPMSDFSNVIVSVRHPNPFLTFWCGTEEENAADLDLVCLCSWPWTSRGPCKSWSCHCSVLIFNLPKPCCGSEALQFSTLEQMLKAKIKKEVSGVCFEDVVYCKVFSTWHFTVAQVENVNVKICIFSKDHQDYLKPKSINLPATERFLVRFFSPCIPLALLWKAECVPSTMHTTNATSDFL